MRRNIKEEEKVEEINLKVVYTNEGKVVPIKENLGKKIELRC